MPMQQLLRRMAAAAAAAPAAPRVMVMPMRQSLDSSGPEDGEVCVEGRCLVLDR